MHTITLPNETTVRVRKHDVPVTGIDTWPEASIVALALFGLQTKVNNSVIAAGKDATWEEQEPYAADMIEALRTGDLKRSRSSVERDPVAEEARAMARAAIVGANGYAAKKASLDKKAFGVWMKESIAKIAPSKIAEAKAAVAARKPVAVLDLADLLA